MQDHNTLITPTKQRSGQLYLTMAGYSALLEHISSGGNDSPLPRLGSIQHVRRHASEKKDMLRCFICESKGSNEMKFSDISHLITHVNSKGHLINKNHLEILALGIPQAKETLTDFIEWEERHSIKKLSYDRMTNKALADQAEQDERQDKQQAKEPQHERGRAKGHGGHSAQRGRSRGDRRSSTKGRGGYKSRVSNLPPPLGLFNRYRARQ